MYVHEEQTEALAGLARQLTARGGEATCVAYCAELDLIAVGRRDAKVVVYSYSKGRMRSQLKNHLGAPVSRLENPLCAPVRSLESPLCAPVSRAENPLCAPVSRAEIPLCAPVSQNFGMARGDFAPLRSDQPNPFSPAHQCQNSLGFQCQGSGERVLAAANKQRSQEVGRGPVVVVRGSLKGRDVPDAAKKRCKHDREGFWIWGLLRDAEVGL